MTPLFHRLAKQLTLPVKKRTVRDHAGLLRRLDDIHCFECTDILEASKDLARKMINGGPTCPDLAFLPAPRTWIEYKCDGWRLATLIEAKHGAAEARVTFIDSGFLIARLSNLRLRSHPDIFNGPYYVDRFGEVVGLTGQANPAFGLYALLALINTPRIIGQKKHMPHRGLEKALLKCGGIQGKFPLRAWTEIKLEIGLPRTAGDHPQEAHLTGWKALHFVKAFMRIRLGQVEIVRAHHRGDASLGIKQSRYKMVKPHHGRPLPADVASLVPPLPTAP